VSRTHDSEREGGDPACWAHLFEDELYGDHDGASEGEGPAPAGIIGQEIVDLAALARDAPETGAAWTKQSGDLNVNLVVFRSGDGVAEHRNTEVDVLLIGVAGEGVVDVDGTPQTLRPGHALIVSKGARRGTRALSDRFAYLTCHRRRGGLQLSR
jgi:quercetin dioxygenase-like cupin family protein